MPQYRFDEIAINSTAKKKPTEADKDTYLGLEHLDSGNLTVTRFGSDVAPIGEKLLMRKGDVLFGKRRAYQKKVAIAPFDGIFSAHGMVLRPRTDVITTEFFPLFIASDYFLDAAIKISVGSLSPTINWSALKELVFNLPAIDEQRSLAGILWAMIDAKNAYMRLIEYTDELVKCQFVEMFGDPFINEKSFSLQVGNNLFVFSSGKFNPTNQLDMNYQYPCYGGNGITGYSKDYLIENETIIIGRVGANCGCVHISAPYSWVTDNAIYLKEYDKKLFDLHFLYQLFCSIEIRRFADGAGQPKISQKPLYDYSYIVPPLPLQTRFADFVRHADKSKFELQQTLYELEATYKALLREKLG